ncbi:uncharacterized protein BKCO1_9000150 [Diplodia corticola]|uniref:DUF7730 domain-containing protein n=1 Tax=Diplodia corticola TaxID=236234 RepID=A0A1J9S8Q9_9PEZI|nr:uncharacterized protein BKCO1_9000150 [Diplodia corticola]OJD36895.1 hypothetical protein BKCO1_9000150 [Diplodia corticola]
MASLSEVYDPPVHRTNLVDLSDYERRQAYGRLEKEIFLARFGSPSPPPIVTSTTVLPTIPTIPICCGMRPDLTIIKLIALAIINHADRSPTGQELLLWIESRFKYFVRHPVALAHIRIRLQDVFLEYDPPVVPLSGNAYQHFAMPWDADNILSLRYAIVVGHLNVIFPPPRAFSMNFRFMKLPSELRLQVYEYTLGMPCRQLTTAQLQRSDLGKKEQNRLLSMVRYDENSDWKGTTLFRCPRVGTVLALLLVSRMVRKEALPIFYRINTFTCKAIFGLTMVRTSMGAAHHSYVRNLVIEYPYWPCGRRVRETLADCAELENLSLWLSRPIDEPDSMGILVDYHELGILRGVKKFAVHGEAPQSEIDTIRAYLESLVTQPREKSEKVAVEEPPAKRRKIGPA